MFVRVWGEYGGIACETMSAVHNFSRHGIHNAKQCGWGEANQQRNDVVIPYVAPNDLPIYLQCLLSCKIIYYHFSTQYAISALAGVRALRPYIELNLVVPQAAASQKRKFITSHKSGTISPNFNQTFKL